MNIDHIQFDNQFNNRRPVIFAPVKTLKKREFKIAESYYSTQDDIEFDSDMPSETKRGNLSLGCTYEDQYERREDLEEEKTEKPNLPPIPSSPSKRAQRKYHHKKAPFIQFMLSMA